MAFYRKKASFHTIERTAEPLLLFLRQNCHMIKEENGEAPLFNVREAFYADKEAMDKISSLYKNIYSMMRVGDFIEIAPVACDWSEVAIYVLTEKDAYLPTASTTHIRLPKLSHLITLTPDDFFSIFQILAAAQTISTGSTFKIQENMPIPPAVAPFFVTNDKTQRMNPEYADRKWTLKSDIKFLSTLEPTELNQLYAMQYLTARQNPDLLYFPVESAIQLELSWDQISDDYVIPSQEE